MGLTSEPAPAAESFAFAAAAGASGVVGVGCFYYALSRGTMGVIAPLAALLGAGVPVLVDLVGGNEPPPARLAGIGMALIAVVLISLPGGEKPGDERRRLQLDLAELPLVILSGLGFAGFFIFIDRASTNGATWWPLVVVRAVGLLLALGALILLAARASGGWRRRFGHVLGFDRLRRRAPSAATMGAILVVAGLGDLGGNAFFVLARAGGEFAVAVVLSSLYPVVTTILAALFLRERLRGVQVAGVVLASLSVPLLR